MRSSTSSSCNSGTAMSLGNRLNTIFKKASELSILCETEVCVIYYGPDGKLQTWPPETEKVKDLALRYKAATKRKKRHNLDELLHKMKYKEREREKKKKRSKKNLKNPIFDVYSPHQRSQLIQSLELRHSKLQERLHFVEAMKQRQTNLVYHHDQTKPALSPNQFSLYKYNHEDNTLSQLPLSAVAHSNYENQMMEQEMLYNGCGQNLLCMDKISNTNFKYPQPYSAFLSELQEPCINAAATRAL